jgi:hypothetical protein
MVAHTGSALWIKFGSTVLSGDYQSFGDTETGGVVDASAGADTNRSYLTTLKDGTATASLALQTSAGTLIWEAVAPLASGTLWWADEGSSASKQIHYVWAIVTERRKSLAYADLVVADVTFQFSSAVADSKTGA